MIHPERGGTCRGSDEQCYLTGREWCGIQQKDRRFSKEYRKQRQYSAIHGSTDCLGDGGDVVGVRDDQFRHPWHCRRVKRDIGRFRSDRSSLIGSRQTRNRTAECGETVQGLKSSDSQREMPIIRL